MVGEHLLLEVEKITFDKLPQVPGLKLLDISSEEYREYDFGDRTYRVTHPIGLYLRDGGTTHRVVDEKGVAHCVPSVGQQGCVLRWVNKVKSVPVQF